MPVPFIVGVESQNMVHQESRVDEVVVFGNGGHTYDGRFSPLRHNQNNGSPSHRDSLAHERSSWSPPGYNEKGEISATRDSIIGVVPLPLGLGSYHPESTRQAGDAISFPCLRRATLLPVQNVPLSWGIRILPSNACFSFFFCSLRRWQVPVRRAQALGGACALGLRRRVSG